MCTVSFAGTRDAVIITSNRDEHIGRENAAAPGIYFSGKKKMIFPKDAKAGGTWFVAADDGTVAVLLNGAFKKHIPDPPYRKSRGLVLLDITGSDDPPSFFTTIDLDHIEPFTVILYQPGNLYELRWDGENKHQQTLDVHGNYIWSSATLYADDIIARRKKIFETFVNSGAGITAAELYRFHADDHGDAENGFVINRQTGMKTFSITQAVVHPGDIQFLHTDLLQEQRFEDRMPINQATIKI